MSVNWQTLRGVLGPACFAAALAAGVVNLQMDSHALVWTSLGFTLLGLGFAHDTSKLLSTAGVERD